MWMSPNPIVARLVGAWEIESTPSGDSARRTIEFHDDGKFWICPQGKRNVDADTYRWRVSEGDLVVIFQDPLSQDSSTGRKIKELARRVGDPANIARSYRYSVSDDDQDIITITLIKERGNRPAQVEWATLTREAEQPRW